MKSYLLEGISDASAAEVALNEALPGQSHPWLLYDFKGDALAYFHIDTHLDGISNIHICAEVSGRHYDQDSAVMALLSRIQGRIGGDLQSDV